MAGTISLAASILWLWFSGHVAVEGSPQFVVGVQSAVEVMDWQELQYIINTTRSIDDQGCGAASWENYRTALGCGWTDPVEIGGAMMHEAQHHWDFANCTVYLGNISESRAIRRQAAYLEHHGRKPLADYLRVIADTYAHGWPVRGDYVTPVNPLCTRWYNPAARDEP